MAFCKKNYSRPLPRAVRGAKKSRMIFWPLLGAMLTASALGAANDPVTESCTIQIYPYVYYLNSASQLNLQVFPQQTCPAEIAQKVLALLQQQAGTIKTKHLYAALPPDLNSALAITPAEIHLQKLNTVLNQSLNLPEHLQINELRFTDGRTYLGSFKPLTTSLENLNLGEKNLKLTYTPSSPLASSSPDKSTWVTGKLQQLQKVLVAQTDIAPQESLNPKMFTSREQAVDQPGRYFTNVEQLSFFKANKALAKNTILKQQDVSAETLVKPQIPAAAIIQQGHLTIKNMAYPRTAGKWGDLVTLEVGQDKKLIQGKVIGHQKVLVQL